MQDRQCIRFLQWALPRLHMQWAGFRKVRKQVCKRLTHRLVELGLADIESYQQYLSRYPDEWQRLDSLCGVVVTRFYRDKLVFAKLTEQVLPHLAITASASSSRNELRVWSIGSASGEEAYTLAIIWQHLLSPQFPALELYILGTETAPHLIKRSQQACYRSGSIKNLPEELRNTAFTLSNDQYCLKPEYRERVKFRQQDIRTTLPDETFDMILCRNLVLTYFDEPLQQAILKRLLMQLRPGGWLVLGIHELLPAGSWDLTVVSERLGLYHR